jgi:hypothetical protein
MDEGISIGFKFTPGPLGFYMNALGLLAKKMQNPEGNEL